MSHGQLIERRGQRSIGLEDVLTLELAEQQHTLRARLADLQAQLEAIWKGLLTRSMSLFSSP